MKINAAALLIIFADWKQLHDTFGTTAEEMLNLSEAALLPDSF